MQMIDSHKNIPLGKQSWQSFSRNKNNTLSQNNLRTKSQESDMISQIVHSGEEMIREENDADIRLNNAQEIPYIIDQDTNNLYEARIPGLTPESGLSANQFIFPQRVPMDADVSSNTAEKQRKMQVESDTSVINQKPNHSISKGVLKYEVWEGVRNFWCKGKI